MPVLYTYPTLTSVSLEYRCSQDIATFRKMYPGTESITIELYSPNNNDTKEILQAKIQPLLTYCNTHLNGNDYAKEISKITDKDQQNKLWVYRTYLFYQLFIYASAIVSSEELYNRICKPIFDQYKAMNNDIVADIVEFRKDIIPYADKFTFGIFGSISPTSDIDVGVTANFNTRDPSLQGPSISYIICVLDAMFRIFTEKSSLQWDIEIYGDLLTLPNNDPVTKHTYPDVFYLDTSAFEASHATKVLLPVISGIVRNIILGYMDNGMNITDSANKITSTSLVQLLLAYSEMFRTYIPSLHTENVSFLSVYDGIHDICNDPTMFEIAKNDAVAYLTLSTATDEKSITESLLHYYTTLYKAEKTQIELLKANTELSVDHIVEIMKSYGAAGVWKMENYISAPTIEHVVRILQANKNSKAKYNTTTPLAWCKTGNLAKKPSLDPYCIIGKYGYIISVLEQIGYVIRFYNTYCDPTASHKSDEKCKKKINKYKDRIDSAIKLLQQFKPSSGGYIKHRTYRKRKMYKKHRTYRK